MPVAARPAPGRRSPAHRKGTLKGRASIEETRVRRATRVALVMSPVARHRDAGRDALRAHTAALRRDDVSGVVDDPSTPRAAYVTPSRRPRHFTCFSHFFGTGRLHALP